MVKKNKKALPKGGQGHAAALRKSRIRWVTTSLLFQSTALAGTLAGLPVPFYSRGYTRAYAAASCDPSSTSSVVNNTDAVASTTFTCTISSSSTLTSPQYAYGGAYAAYQNLQTYKFGYYKKNQNYYYAYFHRSPHGQPGLNISLTNSADIDVTASAATSSLISTSTDSKYLYHQSETQTNGISVVSLGSGTWYATENGGVIGSGGDGGNITITNTGTITSTVGGGIYALSRAGDGLRAYKGGVGGAVTIVSSGDVSGATSGIVAISQGGTSSGPVPGYPFKSAAGKGGTVSVKVYGDVAATTSGPAVLAASYGGNSPRAKSRFYNYAYQISYDMETTQFEGGGGGDGGSVDLDVGSASNAFSGTISTVSSGKINSETVTRATGAALAAVSIGGQGINVYAAGSEYYNYYSGGNGGDVAITVTATTSALITTSGDDSPAVLAQSAGGASPADVGAFYTYLSSYKGGDGGSVTVGLSGGGKIVTSGDNASGIVAQSLGGAGKSTIDDSTYGNAGSAGTVSVTSDFTITTKGAYSHGIVAQSAAAAFGYGIYSYDGDGDIVWGDVNDASTGSDSVTVTNKGNIATYGTSSHGIIAQSIGGGGGVLNATAKLATDSNGFLKTAASQTVGSGSSKAGGSTVTVTNNANITTHGGTTSTDVLSVGDTALTGGIGILAQSIGGGGGIAIGSGATGILGGSGDDGTDGSAGGGVYVTNSGVITTSGAEAHGIVAQSVGGGGGIGQNGYGFLSAIGGKGGNGGDGGTITVTSPGTIGTTGDYASAIIAQSIGGGGGTGGKASSTGILVSVAIGGQGGGGGDGGTVTLTREDSSTISTTGYHATAILLQSIGGGGGSGGAAKATSGGPDFSLSIATGGGGGDGGKGGSVDGHIGETVKTTGADSVGVLAQSIGGGGGDGGGSTAKAIAAGIPDNEEGGSYSLAVSISHGGTGGSGGDGGTAEARVEDGASVSTAGDGASALVVQSIGGGGGSGGDSTASSGTTSLQALADKLSDGTVDLEGEAVSLAIDVSVGGSGGDGGKGGEAYAHNLGSITTTGDFAYGMLMQSIGGGGGSGGTGESNSLSTFGDTKFSAGFTLGGSGATAGDGGLAKGGLSSSGSISTSGSNSNALVVQSIGGGGGTGGGGSGDIDASNALSLGFGGTGGAGGNGGAAYAWNAGKIVTTGDASDGLLVQSIGGGGGTGGSGTSSISHSFEIEKELKKWESAKLALKASADIDTKLSATLGTVGGDGGDGGTVIVGLPDQGQTDFSFGTTKTDGNVSHGVVAQSIGAGGGSVAVSSNQNAATLSTVIKDLDLSVDVDLSLGARDTAGTTGNGGKVNIYAADTYTSGFSSMGVIAQSVGGGGGIATFSGYAPSSSTVTIGSYTTADNSTNTGGDVTVELLSGEKIVTTGDNSNGIMAQSAGGGGGIAITAFGTDTAANDDTVSDVLDIVLGAEAVGSSIGSLDSGTVTVTSKGAITTSGKRAIGIVAQSIAGGGGFIAASSPSISSVTFAQNQYSGVTDAANVSLESSSIQTSGDGAVGIVAQAIGGGGGFAADLSSGKISTYYVSSSDTTYAYNTSSAGASQGVNISVDSNSSISTTGAYAHGIIAQALAGSGGIWQKNGKVYAGSLYRNSASLSGFVDVTVDGSVKVADEHAWGIWAQTLNRSITVTVGASGSISGSTNSDENGGAIHGASAGSGSFYLKNDGTITGNVVTSKAGKQTYAKDFASTASASADGVVSLSTAVPAGSSLMLNTGTGTFTTGAIAGLDTVLNAGAIDIGGEGAIQRTVFSGDLVGIGTSAAGSVYDAATAGIAPTFSDFEYYSRATKNSWRTADASKGGLITGLDVDMENGMADALLVSGDFGGTWGVDVNGIALLPNTRAEFLQVKGTDSSDISVLSSLIFDFTDVSTSSDGWAGFSVANANFADTGVSLGRNATEVTTAMQQVWDTLADGSATEVAFGDDEVSLGQVFGAFHQSTPETFSDMLLVLTSGATSAPLAESPSAAIAAANNVLSCPAFAVTGVMMDEGSCSWGRLYGSSAEQDMVGDAMGYRKSGGGLQVGGQKALGDGWFLGSGMTFENDRFRNDAGTEKLEQQSLTGAVSLKKEVGPWLFGIVGGAGYNWGDSTRFINLDTLNATAKGSPDSAMYFARARASYEFALSDEYYMRPRVDFDVVNMQQYGYDETGAGALNLKVDGNSDTVFGVTPGIEFGARLPFLEDRPARLYGDVSVSFLSNDEWETTARLAGISSMDSFSTFTPIADTVGHVTLGLDLAKRQGTQFRIQYEGSFADAYQSHVGSLRFGYRF
ncbi:autotransporter outer membrane beta-barrel domain-containing protein [uncultured Martelella sp.]|uniref:autotransporter outer membrane beta-barrel domain-containing protein n=1 Tax=uncultured Martelella sp. TaxID=392331 RepID=UPI0029C6F235|nr:autotransporter outer membrane beta-barrel domain-containing protein [uncultured Martelella sp.]